MKKLKRFAAILTSAVLLSGAVPAGQANALYWWGTADGSEFQDMTLLDDKGMFSWIPYGEGIGSPDNYQVYTYHYSFDREDVIETNTETGETKTEMHHYEGDRVFVVCPRENSIQFTVREGLDTAEAEDKMLTILQKYYPDIQDKVHHPGNYRVGSDQPVNEATFVKTGWNDGGYQVVDLSETAGSAEIADGIKRDLAAAGLISAFYTWGQTARYQQVTHDNITAYHWSNGNEWEAVEAWVNTNHPECEFVRVTKNDTELAKKIGYYDYLNDRVSFSDQIEAIYAVIPPDGTTFPEHFAIAAELYAQFGICEGWFVPETAYAPMTGQNALAAAGDVNLDCAIDVSDAVLTARYLAEDKAAKITDQGLQNADADGDGSVTTDDITALLKQIARIE